MVNDIKHRCYYFSIKTIKYLKGKKWDTFSLVIAKQVLRSAMSVGANVIEGKTLHHEQNLNDTMKLHLNHVMKRNTGYVCCVTDLMLMTRS